MLLPSAHLPTPRFVKILSLGCKYYVTKGVAIVSQHIVLSRPLFVTQVLDEHVGRAPTVKSTGVSHLVTARFRDADWRYD
jgi:hypothetical protein